MDANSQRGQALIEFIIFLPFMLMMYTVVVSLGDAIYGSINQQKSARAYFYYRLQNNAQISKPQRSGGNLINQNWNVFGHFFIGWSDYLQGNSPYSPCYKVNLPIAAAAGDKCDQPYSTVTTQYIRVTTAYGACGATFRKDSNQFFELPAGSQSDGSDPITTVTGQQSCIIQ